MCRPNSHQTAAAQLSVMAVIAGERAREIRPCTEAIAKTLARRRKNVVPAATLPMLRVKACVKSELRVRTKNSQLVCVMAAYRRFCNDRVKLH